MLFRSSRRPPCRPTRPSPAPAPAPHGLHPAGAEHPHGQVTLCPAAQGQGGQLGTVGKGARTRRSCWNQGGGGLGRRCCLEMGSKTSEEGSGASRWLRARGIGCGESSRVLRGVCPAISAWRRDGRETSSRVSRAQPWGQGCESPGGVGVLQRVRYLCPAVCAVTVSHSGCKQPCVSPASSGPPLAGGLQPSLIPSPTSAPALR